LQRTIGNRALLRQLQAKSDGLETVANATAFGHDFSRIPVFSTDAATRPATGLAPRVVFHRERSIEMPGEQEQAVGGGRGAAPGGAAIQRQVDDQSEQAQPAAASQPAQAAPVATPDAQAVDAQAGPELVHYRFEIKAWIPFGQVADPEEVLHDLAFRATQPWNVAVDSYASQYRGDAHPTYPGSFRVFTAVEFNWDGSRMVNVQFPADETHFGESHRDWAAEVHDIGGLASPPRAVRGTDAATTDHQVTGSVNGSQEVDLGMSSPNPLTIAPAPNIDADYSLFISQDPSTMGIETLTVRWTTDFMPNHGFRVLRNGVVLREQIVNALATPPSAPEIFVRLNSKSNGGAVTFEP
jgi:hypothetical protein